MKKYAVYKIEFNFGEHKRKLYSFNTWYEARRYIESRLDLYRNIPIEKQFEIIEEVKEED